MGLFEDTLIYIDFETRSRAKLSPPKMSVGSYKYSLDPTTQVLCGCYAFGDGPVIKWTPWFTSPGVLIVGMCNVLNRYDLPPSMFDCPSDLRSHVLAGKLVAAHNTSFERDLWENILVPEYGWPQVYPEQWLCTMAIARYNGLPGGLGKAAEALKLSVRKSDSSAMQKMCKPRAAWEKTNTGAVWFADAETYQENVDYCAQDVETERALHKACAPLPPKERKVWLLDQEINRRGIPVDIGLARIAAKKSTEIKAAANRELAEITNGVVTKSTQTARFLKWFNEYHDSDLTLDNLQAGTVQAAICNSDIDPILKRVLEIRQLSGGNALAKYDAFLRYAHNKRIYEAYIYYGGHTGRASATGVQFQNLINPPMSAEDAEALIYNLLTDTLDSGIDVKKLLDSLVRAVICAEPGHTLISVDYKSIEARGVAWLAGDERALDLYRRGIDTYTVMAALIFSKNEADVTPFERKVGKTTELGAGYGMWYTTFYDRCKAYGMDVSEELAKLAITTYRRVHRPIKKLWDAMGDCAQITVRTGAPTWTPNRKIMFRMQRIGNVNTLVMVLPSGRALYYPQATVKGNCIQYYGRMPKGGYGLIYIRGNGLTENAVQAFCRDLLMPAMLRLSKILDIIMHVHDELVAHILKQDADRLYKIICDTMTEVPIWATGMPIDVEGWIGPRFKKG